MKFYNLMKEHENDLARIIVGLCVFIIEACLHSGIDPREWQDIGRGEGGYRSKDSQSYTPCDDHH